MVAKRHSRRPGVRRRSSTIAATAANGKMMSNTACMSIHMHDSIPPTNRDSHVFKARCLGPVHRLPRAGAVAVIVAGIPDQQVVVLPRSRALRAFAMISLQSVAKVLSRQACVPDVATRGRFPAIYSRNPSAVLRAGFARPLQVTAGADFCDLQGPCAMAQASNNVFSTSERRLPAGGHWWILCHTPASQRD